MKSLIIRSLSAIVAVLFIYFLYYFWQKTGLLILIGLGVLAANFEISKILFSNKEQTAIWQRFAFIFLSLLVFGISTSLPHLAWLIFSVALIIYISFTILLEDKFSTLNLAQAHISSVVMGFFYGAFLPLSIYEILARDNGQAWFILLLLLVFTGDTLAYFSGMLWGEKKISPRISPKKTFIGAIGGIVGSVLATLLFSYFYLSELSIFQSVFIGVTVGLSGQMGDFFESLLKRVVDIKDSGSIMPGHGGILDRIDGVLFASPVMLLWILSL